MDPNKYFNPLSTDPEVFRTGKNTIVYREFSFDVATAGESVEKQYELPKHADQLIGIQIFSSVNEQLQLRGQMGFRLNERELFPNDFSARNLMTGINAPAMLRFYPILNHPKEIGDRIIKYRFKDSTDSPLPFVPYRVFVAIQIVEKSQ